MSETTNEIFESLFYDFLIKNIIESNGQTVEDFNKWIKYEKK